MIQIDLRRKSLECYYKKFGSPFVFIVIICNNQSLKSKDRNFLLVVEPHLSHNTLNWQKIIELLHNSLFYRGQKGVTRP